LWQESWWVKAVLELGVIGLFLAIVLYGGIAVRAVSGHIRLRDPGFRAVSAGITALLIWTLLYNFKAQYIDFDPLNVYYWFLAGVLMKIFVLDRAKAKHQPGPQIQPIDGTAGERTLRKPPRQRQLR
jgi:hypothetical protein